VTALVDGGATHNFIDVSLVARRGLHTKEFGGFHVAMADAYTMTCLDMIPDLEVKLGNYTMIDTFYVVDLSDTDVVLGVQWLYSLGNVNVYAIIIVLCISIDKSIIRTKSLRNTHSQETRHLSWETL
jgi:hypothetical protein